MDQAVTLINWMDSLFFSDWFGKALDFAVDYRLAIIIVLAAFAFLVYVGSSIRFYVKEGNKLTEPGYLTPRVTSFAITVRAALSRFFTYFRVGRLIVLHRERIEYNGRLIILPNHQIEKDAVVVPAVLGRLYFRGLMAITQIIGARKPLAAFLGAIPVHHDKNPMASMRTAIKALNGEKDSSLVVFPQGKLVRNNELKRDEFFAGALLIGRHAQKKSELPFAALPMGIYYDRDPKHATLKRRLSTFLFLSWLGTWFKENTYGVTVAIGEPIPFSELPEDNDAAMDIVFQRTVELCQEAERETIARFKK